MTTLYFVNGCGTEYTKSSKRIDSTKKSVTKRPPNSFILYRREKQKNTTILTMNLHSKDLSKEVAKMWKEEPEEIRLKYQRMADEEKDRHFRKHPEYKYTPQQRKRRTIIEDRSSPKGKIKSTNNELLNNVRVESIGEEHAPQQGIPEKVNFDQVNEEEFTFSEDLFDHIVSIPPTTLPSSVVDISQLFPGGSNLDMMSVKNYELFTILSFTQSTQPGF